MTATSEDILPISSAGMPSTLVTSPDRRPETEAVLIRHHGDLTLAILLEYVFQNFVSFVPRKINIDAR